MDTFLENHEKCNDPESLITICVVDMRIAETLLFAEEHLKKAQKIVNSARRKKINDALYGWIHTLRGEDPEHIISRLVFVGAGWIDLQPDQIQMAKKFKLINPYYRTGDCYECMYFRDFFLNQDFDCMVRLEKSKIQIFEWTITKEQSFIRDLTYVKELRQKYKQLYVQKIVEEGAPVVEGIVVDTGVRNRSQFFEWKEKRIMLEHHALLQQRLQALKNPKTNLDLYVFGRLRPTILSAIEAYQLKELFIDEKKLVKLRQLAPREALNFLLIPLRVLEKGDVADSFFTEYNGLMGIRYFAV